MVKPFTKRAKLRHLEAGSEKYLKKASVGARLAAVARGNKAIVKWHEKVGTDLSRLEKVLKEKKADLISGNMTIPEKMKLNTIDQSDKKGIKTGRVSVVTPLMSALGTIVGSVVGASVNHPGYGAVAGGAALALSGLNEGRLSYNASMRSEFLRLRKLLKKERLFVARKGENLSDELRVHNKRVVEMVEDRIIRLSAENKKQKEKVQATLKD
ncbi:MAG: hypothetical protein Q7S21_00945 [archaeon]|nr:hypothetical protein [archaeon]